MTVQPIVERHKKYVKEHVTDKIKCPQCKHMVDAVWHDGIVGLSVGAHQCTEKYEVSLDPNIQEGTLFDIEKL